MELASLVTYVKRPQFPGGTYAFLLGFRKSATWIVPFTGKYRFICIGRGGAGGPFSPGTSVSSQNGSGGGGGSGGWCEKTMELQAGESLTMQVTVTYSRIVSGTTVIMVANRGTNGGFGRGTTVGTGGKGGTATGGDTNHNGLAGNPGTSAALGNTAPGGDGAHVADWEQLSQYLSGAYGLGGLSGDNTTPIGLTPTAPELFGLMFGAGSGGGAVSAEIEANQGGEATPGCIIVEYVLG